MNRIVRVIIAVVFIAVITFSTITICQNVGKLWRLDVTDQRLFTLSDGTEAILAGLNQPIKLKLYYTKTAAMKAPDQIRYFNNYYYFVRALLAEYAAAGKGMIDLQIIDPRPFSEDETQAIQHGLRRFSITEEENFFFGLVVQTQFGVEKKIEFFSPDRQKFVEYDITYLIDTAITRQKKRIGIISSLPVVGDDVSGYMARLMAMQGQQPTPAWAIVRHLKQSYEVNKIETDIEEITDVDILLVIHPKDLPANTLFAIDQFILEGGRAIICIDPHCVLDRPDSKQQFQMPQAHQSGSNVKELLSAWSLEMPEGTFAGDRSLAMIASLNPQKRPEPILALLGLTGECFNPDTVISADLNRVKVLYPGVLKKTSKETDAAEPEVKFTQLLRTTNRGNTWRPTNPYELMMPDYTEIMNRFTDGTERVVLGYLITGKFKSAFPDGIDIPAEPAEEGDEESAAPARHLSGMVQAAEDCAVAVFADVDFISDTLAYQESFFGLALSAVDDNSSLLLNTIDDLSGSSNLISIRSRGNFTRPFTVVDAIEVEADAESAAEEQKVKAEIANLEKELNDTLASGKAQEGGIIETAILNAKKELDVKLHRANSQLRQIKMKKRQRIELLGRQMRNFCTLPGPIVTLVIAVILAVRRSLMRRRYISHRSDA